MRHQTQQRVVAALARISFLGAALFVCHSIAAAAHSSTIICREELSAEHRETLADRLRSITGLPIEFERNGGLGIGSSATSIGSKTARDLITRALAGTKVTIVEDATGRQDVVFSRVLAAKWKHPAGGMPETFVIQIDFTDFDQLIGDELALKAFDVGWAFLHELDHVVNDHSDADGPQETGECEEHINVMRRECDLPVRADYFYTYFPAIVKSDFRTRFVRLPFDADAGGRKHRYWVMWDATLVGGLSSQIAKAP